MSDSKNDNIVDAVKEIETDAVEVLDQASDEDALDVADDAHGAAVDPHEDMDAQEFEYEDERGVSMSARILTWLILLLAGGGLALWGAPKVAPNLPEWAAPAAKLLTPGTSSAEASFATYQEQSQNEISSLREELDATRAAIAEGPDQEQIKSLIQSELTTSQEQLTSEIDTLKDQLSATDGTDIEARLAQLETRFEGVSTELTSINTSLQDAVTSNGTISDDALAQISSKAAEVEGLRAQMTEMAAQIGGVAQRIDNVEAAADRRVEEANAQAAQATEQAAEVAANTALQSALGDLTQKASMGEPFATQLDALNGIGLTDLPDILVANAEKGVLSTDILQTQFSDASRNAVRASIKADAESGAMSRVGAFLQSQVATRSLEPQEGDGTDAVLSRMDAAIQRDDMEQILSEAESLNESASAPLAGWLDEVKRRASVLGAIAALNSHPS